MFRFTGRLAVAEHAAFGKAATALPLLEGAPIQIEIAGMLRCYQGKVVRRGKKGIEIHAASDLRRRLILLEKALFETPAELRRVLLHEVFHFAWVRLGNPRRRSFERLLASECQAGAAGELGWSAENRKRRLRPDDWRLRSRPWRRYACESFCDTAAWCFGGLGRHAEFTLDGRNRTLRRRWMRNLLTGLERIRI